MIRGTALILLCAATALPAQQVPRPSPPLTINMTNGLPPVSLAKYKGKVTILYFLNPG